MLQEQGTSFIHPEAFWRSVGLRAGQTVVHLGCGPGFFVVPAAKLVGSSGRVIGVDIRQDMLEETESRARRQGVEAIVQTVRADIEQDGGSGLPEHTAMWVLVANILHQADQRKILTEARRLVKDQGSVIVVEWDTVATPLGPPPETRLAKEEVLQTAQALGLVVRDSFVPSPYHYGLILSPAK